MYTLVTISSSSVKGMLMGKPLRVRVFSICRSLSWVSLCSSIKAP
jgi:hypothetical protein